MESKHEGLLEKEPLQEPEENAGSESDVDLDNAITEEEREELLNELTKLEEEILTLKQVIVSKENLQTELKHRLGVTVLSELKQNLSRSWTDVQSSTVYRRTSETLSTAGQKTSVAFSSLGTAITRKLEDVRLNAIAGNSQGFRSFEEKVETTVSSIKSKVGPSSGGGSFQDVLSSAAQASAQSDPTPKPTLNNNPSESSDSL